MGIVQDKKTKDFLQNWYITATKDMLKKESKGNCKINSQLPNSIVFAKSLYD